MKNQRSSLHLDTPLSGSNKHKDIDCIICDLLLSGEYNPAVFVCVSNFKIERSRIRAVIMSLCRLNLHYVALRDRSLSVLNSFFVKDSCFSASVLSCLGNKNGLDNLFIDKLISCGIKPETINSFIQDSIIDNKIKSASGSVVSFAKYCIKASSIPNSLSLSEQQRIGYGLKKSDIVAKLVRADKVQKIIADRSEMQTIDGVDYFVLELSDLERQQVSGDQKFAKRANSSFDFGNRTVQI